MYIMCMYIYIYVYIYKSRKAVMKESSDEVMFCKKDFLKTLAKSLKRT